jgi:rSAM/selenodomain-associated transferase 2
LEIIIVDGDEKGSTIRMIREASVVTAISKRGRGSQMNRGAAMARGDILLFLHADTRLPGNALALIESEMRDPLCMAGAFDLAIASGKPIYRLIEKGATVRSRLTRIPYGDQAHFFRRSYFQTLGGFAEIPIMEDVEIMGRVKRRGDRIEIISNPVLTSARRWEKEGIVMCTLRNWLLIILYFFGISPMSLTRFYYKG